MLLSSKKEGRKERRMNFPLARITLLALVAKSTRCFPIRSIVLQRHAVSSHSLNQKIFPGAIAISRSSNSRVFSSSEGAGGEMPSIRQIGKAEMKQIIDEYSEAGREGSGYLVLDVRFEDEVAMTGKLAPNVITLPLPLIMQANVFSMDPDEFEDACGFPKPELDETIVFSCAAGIRSQQAAFFAAKSGYTNLINYAGGANEWF